MENPPQIHLDPIKYLNNLPVFNGNINELHTFTTLIDRVYPLLSSYDELSQLLFSDIIKSRISGKAKEVIEINTQAQSWASIKTILQNNFGERKSSDQLFDELRAVTFQSNVVDFFNDIKHILRRLNNKMRITLGEGEAANQVSINNQRTALHIFKNKMPEPMKTILACRNPTSLEQAMDILYENEYDRIGRDGRFHPGRSKHNLDYKRETQPNPPKHKSQQNSNTQGNRQRYNYNEQQLQQNFYKNKNNQQGSYTNSQYRNISNHNNYQSNQQGSYPGTQYRTGPNHNHYQNNQQRTNTNPQYRPNYNPNPQRNSSNFYNRSNLDTNYQQNNQPEPMDVNIIQNAQSNQIHENFQFPASRENYHI